MDKQADIIKAVSTDGNLKSYEEARVSFDWADVEKQFSWYTTGKVNMAYEAIDRHVEAGLQDKVALYYSDATRDEAVTYGQMKANSNKFGNVLRKLGVGKGDRVFIFMPRSPELYFALLGTIKIGAIAGPLFEAFMEQAVRDRLEDAEAAAIVTTPALLGRVPVSSL
ncbi:AMP-binding protein, partial [Paenibacillus sp. GYB004]|uniref:AMP-binding protein n=1 Tax=Paenibacillus sp. GYB004 TaxID=2994393 RepID=UPI002F96142C